MILSGTRCQVFVPLFGELCKTGEYYLAHDAGEYVFVPLFGELCKTVICPSCKAAAAEEFSSPCSGNYVKQKGNGRGFGSRPKGFRPLVRGTM